MWGIQRRASDLDADSGPQQERTRRMFAGRLPGVRGLGVGRYKGRRAGSQRDPKGFGNP